ncbi:MAG: type IV pilus modification protein PilV [Magnetococcales bacterium]|nr:type IV pilus modification protein PilV [Magnetococcales bacterium]
MLTPPRVFPSLSPAGPSPLAIHGEGSGVRLPGGRSSHGFTLLEVLITLVVLSIGLLGLAKLQLSGIHDTNDSYFRTQAILYAYDMSDRMRSNAEGVEEGGYNNVTATPASPTDCTAADCTAAQLATFDAWQWRTAIADSVLGIPSGNGTVTGSGLGSVYTITVSWSDPHLGNSQFVVYVRPQKMKL